MSTSNRSHFIELYSKEQKKIFLYILSMVHNRSDAEEIMQQTAMDMWNLFDRFSEGSNFAAWGCTVARFRILDFRKKQKKDKLFLSNEVYDKVVAELESVGKQADKRKDALQGCLKKLKGSDVEMLKMHYEDNFTYKKIAEDLNVSKTGIYKVMSRIHTNLQKCIKQTLLIWETNG